MANRTPKMIFDEERSAVGPEGREPRSFGKGVLVGLGLLVLAHIASGLCLRAGGWINDVVGWVLAAGAAIAIFALPIGRAYRNGETAYGKGMLASIAVLVLALVACTAALGL
jgi:hypothetical protein